MGKIKISNDIFFNLERAMNASTIESWYNPFFQFVDDFRYSPSESVLQIPGSNPDPKLRALYAATVAILCRDYNLKIPSWVRDTEKLTKPWFVSGVENLKAMAIIESDPIYKSFNIFVLGNFLTRV